MTVSKRRPRRSPARPRLHVLAALTLSLAACGSGDEPAEVRPEVVQARDRAAEYGLWEKDGWVDAQRAMEPIVAVEDAAAEDLLRMACALLGQGAIEEAQPFVARAAKLAPEHPIVRWCRFRVARIEYDNDTALREIRALRQALPEDIPTRLALGMVLSDLAMDDPDDEQVAGEAIDELEAFLAMPPETTGSWRVTALFRLSSLLSRRGEDERAEGYFAEYKRYGDQGIDSPGEPEHQPGSLGAIPPHTPGLFEVPKPTATEPVVATSVEGFEDARGVLVMTLGPDPEPTPMPGGPSGEELWGVACGTPALVAFGPRGVHAHERQDDGSYGTGRALCEADVLDAVAYDRGNKSTEPTSFRWRREGDAGLDLIVATKDGDGAALHLLEELEGTWTLHAPFFRTQSPIEPGHIVPVDLDHEGDLDLIVASTAGLHVLRNDAFDADTTGGFADVSTELPLPKGAFRPQAEDVDRDNDVDMVFVDEASGATRVLSSERGWRFVDATATAPSTSGRFALVQDLDGTGFPDFAEVGAQELRVHRRGGIGGGAGVLTWPLDPSVAPSGPPIATDWDLDGVTDLVWPTEDGTIAGVLAPGFETGGTSVSLIGGRGTAGTELCLADLDGDQALDVVALDGQGLRFGSGSARGLTVSLRGYKDNTRGVGAEISVREGLRYRRIFWDGRPQTLAVGADGNLDMLRIVWPNGVIQSYFELAPERCYAIWQRPGLVGSCPFLYVWDGTSFTFVSDVLGITPLGLPMAPGMLVPPDHDEFVLVSGDVMREKDGFYEMQFTEELREVTYLDRIRLDVIDHPADVEVFPNERFTFPPFPEHHVHTVRKARTATSVVDGDGKDWTEELAANDMQLAIPFEPLEGQFQGLATPHTLELSFANDAEALREASKLRLLLNGWFYWTDASVNMAAARHQDVEFVPPLLQVPDANGEWQTVGPPLGFPAGKLKTMVVDVTPFLNRDDPRLRVTSTLRLYWDSIRLAVDNDDADFAQTSLEPATADLWERGFSEAVTLAGPHRLEWFEWDRLTPAPRWNQHPGRYTRFGDCLELTETIDDRYIVMGAGDALHVRFDARELPPLPDGWRRDFLVFLDGWAKDRDPNTIEALHVDPLPFHGMSAYPYPASESFPDDEQHRRWRAEWQTRPAKRWIDPVVPPTATQGAGRARL